MNHRHKSNIDNAERHESMNVINSIYISKCGSEQILFCIFMNSNQTSHRSPYRLVMGKIKRKFSMLNYLKKSSN